MTSKKSISATELARMGVCKASIKTLPGVRVKKRSFAQYQGDMEHERTDNEVRKFIRAAPQK